MGDIYYEMCYCTDKIPFKWISLSSCKRIENSALAAKVNRLFGVCYGDN